MKTSTLKTKINRLLKFLGFNVVRAKRARKPRAARAIIDALTQNHATRKALNADVLKKFNGDRPPYTAEELAKTPYVGYDCDRQTTCDENRVIDPPSHTFGKDTIFIGVPQQPNSDNDVKGPTS